MFLGVAEYQGCGAAIPWLAGGDDKTQSWHVASNFYDHSVTNDVNEIGLVDDPWALWNSWTDVSKTDRVAELHSLIMFVCWLLCSLQSERWYTYGRMGLALLANTTQPSAPHTKVLPKVATDAADQVRARKESSAELTNVLRLLAAQQVPNLIAAGAGHHPRDSLSIRALYEAFNSQGWFGYRAIIYQNTNDLDLYAATLDVTDSDHDGIPDAWELAHGLNPRNASDAALPFNVTLTQLDAYLDDRVTQLLQPPTVALARHLDTPQFYNLTVLTGTAVGEEGKVRGLYHINANTYGQFRAFSRVNLTTGASPSPYNFAAWARDPTNLLYRNSQVTFMLMPEASDTLLG